MLQTILRDNLPNPSPYPLLCLIWWSFWVPPSSFLMTQDSCFEPESLYCPRTWDDLMWGFPDIYPLDPLPTSMPTVSGHMPIIALYTLRQNYLFIKPLGLEPPCWGSRFPGSCCPVTLFGSYLMAAYPALGILCLFIQTDMGMCPQLSAEVPIYFSLPRQPRTETAFLLRREDEL